MRKKKCGGSGPKQKQFFPLAPTRCGPVGGAELECGRIEIEAPESTKKFRLLLESFRKIRFFVGKVDIAVTNSGTATEGGGGQQGGIGLAAAGKCGPATGLLVFLVGAALLALVGLVAEAGVVETQTLVAAALGCPLGWASGGSLTCCCRASCGGTGRGICRFPEKRLLAQGGGGCGSGGLLGGLGHPQCVATLDHLLRGVKGPRVDQSADVARQLAEEKGDLRVCDRHWLQGGQVVPQDGGPVVATHGVIQPFVGHLLVPKAVGLQ
jgi:hypothetical protein